MFIVALLTTAVSSTSSTDPCNRVCEELPGVCGGTGSSCESTGCRNLFWQDETQSMPCHSSSPLCSSRTPLTCGEASRLADRSQQIVPSPVDEDDSRNMMDPVWKNHVLSMGGVDFDFWSPNTDFKPITGADSPNERSSHNFGKIDPSAPTDTSTDFDDDWDELLSYFNSEKRSKKFHGSDNEDSDNEDDLLQYALALSRGEDIPADSKAVVRDGRPGRLGFRNIGNTCWLAAISQALLHSPRVLELIRAAPLGVPNMIFDEIRKLSDQMWEGNETGKPIEPFGVASGLARFGFKVGAMADGLEAIQTILNELKTAQPAFSRLFGIETRILSQCSGCHNDLERTPPLDMELILPIPPEKEGSSSVSLVDCLREFSELENVEAVECASCAGPHDAKTRYHIETAGDLMLIALRRFDNQMKKIETRVEFPHLMNFTSLDFPIGNYRLVSVIHHDGLTRDTGHYRAEFYHNQEWVQANDETVSSVGGDGLATVSRTAYLLIYERV
jgi:hypothetical protein